MDNFVVSARKYRPATFKTVVGQDSITTTLKNAIRNNHLAQAFLFCGPRGVGKTTCARILAKTINCTQITDENESCNECESCVSFNNGQSLNIYELDAASNNSVDDIRGLVEQVRYPPHSGKYKIYIIDEVHMLSTSAFNAFLKTLEEPPPYAIFILATTEKHKIIPTILSRCQIFDFNRISVDDIAQHLSWIAEMEKVSAEAEALHTIAQKADGALRDALSIFDQIVSYAGNEITYKSVIDNLNILDYDYYFRITDHILNGEYPKALLILDEIMREGFDLHNFINGLTSHFRDLLISKDEETIRLLEVGPGIKEKYQIQSRSIQPSQLFELLDIGNKCDTTFKSSQNQRLLVEITLLRMSRITSAIFNNSEQPLIKTETPRKPTVAIPEKKAGLDNSENQKTKPVVPEKPVIISEALTQNKESKQVEQEDVNTRQLSGTVSIKERLSKKKQTNEVASEQNKAELPATAFNQDLLALVWEELTNKFESEDRKQLATTLGMYAPRVISDKEVRFMVGTTVQQTEFNTNKTEIMDFIRRKLNNFVMDVSCEVSETEDRERKPYTNSEKFQKMAEKNPDLNTFKKQFDLDFD